MRKLIQLEIKKNNLRPYLWSLFFIFIFGLGFCFLLGFIPIIEAAEGGPVSDDTLQMFSTWENFFPLIAILFSAAFSIFSAVMHSKFTLEEYVGKRSVLLFSYPHSRRRILFAKCSLVFFITVIGMMIINTLAIVIFALCSNVFHLMATDFSVTYMPNILSIVAVCSLLSGAIGLIAMRVGFWKKSLMATVVTAVILIVPFCNTMSVFPQFSQTIQFIGMLLFLILGLLIFTELSAKVNKMEAL